MPGGRDHTRDGFTPKSRRLKAKPGALTRGVAPPAQVPGTPLGCVLPHAPALGNVDRAISAGRATAQLEAATRMAADAREALAAIVGRNHPGVIAADMMTRSGMQACSGAAHVVATLKRIG